MSTILDRAAERAAAWLVGQPRQVAVVLAVTVVSSVGCLALLRPAAGLDVFVAPDEPSRVLLKEVEQAFVSDEVVFLAYETEDPFSHDALAEVRRLGDRLAALEWANGAERRALFEEVVSLATVKDVSGADLSFRSVPLVPADVPTDRAELAAIRARAERNPLIRDSLLSSTRGSSAAMLVRFEQGLTTAQRSDGVEQVRAVLREPWSLRFHVTGGPVAEVDTLVYMQEDLKRFIPVTYVLILALMYFFTRRVAGVVLAVINATVAVVFGMAMVALFSSLNNLSTITPPLLMVLSVATVTHFLTEYAHNTHLVGPEQAARKTLAELLVPAFMCELTTAVGFASFVTSRVPALKEFGVAASLAVMGAFATSFLVLAVVVRWSGADRLISGKAISTNRFVEQAVSRYTELVIRRPWPMLLSMVVVAVVAAVGLKWFHINHDNLTQFAPGVPIRTATDYVNQHHGGSSEYLVSIRTPDENRFLEPSELQKLEQLAVFLEAEAGVTTTTSAADFVKLMNRGFNDDAEAEWRVPDHRDQVAQLVLLNGDDRLFQYVDRQWAWVRVSGRTTESGSAAVSARLAHIERYLAAKFPSAQGYDAHVTGSTRMSAVMSTSILDGQTTSFLLSLVLIFVPIALAFRSSTAALYTIPSNVFPILACMGLMGWVNIPLDVATSMITAIVLGIAVDDTIHFVQSMRARLVAGDSLEDSLRYTMATKGVGALWITLIVTLGFAALVSSSFGPTSNFGLLTAFAMVAGIVAELLLLPPLMLVMRTRLGVPERSAQVDVTPPLVQEG